MRRLLILFFIIIMSFNAAQAIEEIKLDTTEEKINTFDYLAKVYNGEIEKKDEVSPILRLFSQKGLEFKNSPINAVKLTLLYGSTATYNLPERSSKSFVHDFGVLEPMATVWFNNYKSQFMFDINTLRNIPGYSNGFTEKINQFFISHKISDNQTILFGQGARLPNTYNGSLSIMAQEFVLKSQLGRTFGDIMSVGVRNLANYKYVDYDIGVYDSTRYMRDFGRGYEFSGQIAVKPFSNFNEKYGTLKLGSGYNIGEYNASYNMYSFFTTYDYNKAHFRAEYANADGYNSIVYSNNKADGFYTTLAYDITQKISLIGRYDYFNPNKDAHKNDVQEFTAGITYKPVKNMKIMLNFARRNYSNKEDSNMIMFATRFLI